MSISRLPVLIVRYRWFFFVLIYRIVIAWLRKLIRRRRSCRDCRFFNNQYLTAYDGMGLYKFGYCLQMVTDRRVVDPDLPRKCLYFIEGEYDPMEDNPIIEEGEWP